MTKQELKDFCENSPLIAHHAKFERKWLLSRGIDPNIIDDTMLLAYLYDERMPLDLESLVLRFEIDKPFKEEYGLDVSKIEGERLRIRNTKDARNTKVLRDILKVKLTKEELYVYEKVLMPATRTLALIENRGVCINRQAVEQLQVELNNKILELDIDRLPEVLELEKMIGVKFNINSYLHRGVLIYDLLGYTPLPFSQAQTEGGDPSTQAKVLRQLLLQRKTETLEKLLKFTSYTGYKESYEGLISFCDGCGRPHWDTIDGIDYIFTNLHIGGTSTGRIRSDHPNMQNTPSRDGAWTRKVFTSRYPKGLIVECDYDQIELKILAGLSGDDKLIDDFLSGKDPHIEMAKVAFNVPNIKESDSKYADYRFLGKTLNYAVPFGRGAAGVAFDTGRTIPEAQVWLKRYWKEHSKLRKWLDNVPQEGIVYSPTGMKRHCDTWTQGKNFPIQNSALIVLLIAMNQVIDQAIRLHCPIDLCIHDSIRFDLEDETKLLPTIKEFKEYVEFKPGELYSWLPIPLTVTFKAGRTWADANKIKLTS